jgi:hypothetical protein
MGIMETMNRTPTTDLNESDLNELNEMMDEELEKAYPSYSDYEPPAGTATNSRDGSVVPITDRDQERIDRYAEEFMDELSGKDGRKMMFVLDIAIHCGETKEQLRFLIDEAGIEPVYTARMAIHLAAKEMGVTYHEVGKIIGDQIYGTEKGTLLQ